MNGQRRGGAHLLVAVALAGCALVEPQAPSVETGLDADDRYAAADPGAPAPQSSDLYWWRRFDDPLVTEWVERALAAAPDIAIGRERIAQAEAALRVAQAQRQPAIATFASANYDTRPTGRNRRGRVSAALTLEWDADLAGGLRFAERSAAARLLDAAEARARESALVYRKTLLQALGEVEAALVGSDGASARIDALRRSTRAAQAAVDDARTLYTAGLSDFLHVLDARRTALERQRELLRARADSARFAVATFEALGLIDEPDAVGASMAPEQDTDRGLTRHP